MASIKTSNAGKTPVWKGKRMFSPEQIIMIRQEYATAMFSLHDLAKKYGCSHVHIHHIVTGKIYKWQTKEKPSSEPS